MELFSNSNFFTKLYNYKSFSFENDSIKQIILFRKNKLLILSKNIFLFDISTNITLCKKTKPQNSLNFIKIEIINENKIIALATNNSLIIYELFENRTSKSFSYMQKYILQLQNNRRIFTILYNQNKNQLIALGPIIYVYGYKNNNLHLQITIHSNNINQPFINGILFMFNLIRISLDTSWRGNIAVNKTIYCNISLFRQPLKVNKNIFGLFGKENTIEFWNTKDYKLIQKCFIFSNFYCSSENKILNLNNNDLILFGIIKEIALYSFKNNRVLKIFNCQYINRTISTISKFNNNGPIYVSDDYNIYKLDIKKDKIFKVNKWYYPFYSSLICYDNNIILSSRNSIIFFRPMKYKALILDVISFLFICLYIAFLMKIFKIFYMNIFCYAFVFVLSCFLKYMELTEFLEYEIIKNKNRNLVIFSFFQIIFNYFLIFFFIPFILKENQYLILYYINFIIIYAFINVYQIVLFTSFLPIKY